MKNIKFDDNFETILVCAERYALGRESYMPSLVIAYITPLIPELSDKAIANLERDLRLADEMDRRTEGFEAVKGFRHGIFGDDHIDKPGWINFWNKLKSEMEKRGLSGI